MASRQKLILALGGILASCLCLLVLTRVSPPAALFSPQEGSQDKMIFWVKVVDQKDQGIQGYKCRVVEEQEPLLPFITRDDVVRIFETGADGTFAYKWKKATLRVFWGYSWASQWTLNPQHLLQRRNLNVTTSAYKEAIRKDPTGYLGSKENPFLLRVCTVGSPQKLLFWKELAQVKEPGNYACIDLLSARLWESKTPEGDVAISEGLFGRKGELPQCFHYLVAGPRCGIAPVLDDWGLCPPETGYQRELCAPRDWDARKWSLDGTPVYYRIVDKAGTGVIYGRLKLISPSLDKAFIESYTNLQGERNLFYRGYATLFDQKILDYVQPPATLAYGQESK